MESIGIKVARQDINAFNAAPKELAFSSSLSTYMVARVITTTAISNPHIVSHGLNYVPKVLVYQILQDHSRKLPYEDPGSVDFTDFSVTESVVKIRFFGIAGGTFKIYIFTQPLLGQ